MGEKQDAQANGFWLFGYGSLIWKPPPHYDQRVPGYIEGYVRRFWQASEDHRGTPEAPGRVVTLIDRQHYNTLEDDHVSPLDEKVWGAAYHIPGTHEEEVKSYLDIREINGYSIQYTTFHPAASEGGSGELTSASTIADVMVYIGLPENPQFMGPQDPRSLAEHIYKSKGPSGLNKEYLYQLGTALEELSPESGDDHVRDLVGKCQRLEAAKTDIAALDAVDGDGTSSAQGSTNDTLEEAEPTID